MKIYSPNGDTIFCDIPITEACEHTEELMQGESVKLSWRDITSVELPIGAYITPFATEKEEGVRYVLFQAYEPSQKTEDEYLYEPVFQHPKMLLGYTPCLFATKNADGTPTEESEWVYTGGLSGVMEYMAEIIKRYTGWEFGLMPLLSVDLDLPDAKLKADDIPASATCSFSNMDILSALGEICSQFKCEYHIDWGNATIYYGIINRKIGEKPTVLEVGGNVEVPSISSNKEEKANCYMIVGGTRNITLTTPRGENVQTNKRLTLKGLETESERFEDSVIDLRKDKKNEPKVTRVLQFDDVYPKLDLYVYDVRRRSRRMVDSDEHFIPETYNADGTVATYKKFDIIYMRLAYRSGGVWHDYLLNDIDPKKDIVNGKTLSASFEPNEKGTHSAMAGREHELVYHNVSVELPQLNTNEDTGVKIRKGDYEIKFEQNEDLVIPNQYLMPWGAGTTLEELNEMGEEALLNDKVVLFNIVMPDTYIKTAKRELYDKALLEIKRIDSDKNTYTVKTRAHSYTEDLSIGQNVTLLETDGTARETRVMKLVRKLDYPCEATITLGSTVLKGLTETLKDDVSELHFTFNQNTTLLQNNSSLLQQLLRSIQETKTNYLRKDSDDETPFKLTMKRAVVKNGQQWGVFEKGISGAEIDGNGNGEMGRLVLREALVVPKITFNEIECIAGNNWRTAGGGTIDIAYPEYEYTGKAKLLLEANQIGRVAVDDICQGVFHLSDSPDGTTIASNETVDEDQRNGNFRFSGFTTIYFKVTKVYDKDISTEEKNTLASVFGMTLEAVEDGLQRHMFIDYELRAKECSKIAVTDRNYWIDATHPQNQMDFACYSNANVAERQQCIYETPRYEIMLVGMSDWTYGADNIVYIRGELNGFNIKIRKEFDPETGEWSYDYEALKGWGLAYGNSYSWGQAKKLDRPAVVISQQLMFWAREENTAPPLPETEGAGWTVTSQSPTPEKPYLWQIYRYTYDDEEDTSVRRYSEPWLASNWSKDGTSITIRGSVECLFDTVEAYENAVKGIGLYAVNDKTPILYYYDGETTTSISVERGDCYLNKEDGHLLSAGDTAWVDAGQIRGQEIKVQYSAENADGTYDWHDSFTEGDVFMHISMDSGSTWGSPMRIVGENGEGGAYTDYSYQISAYERSANALTPPADLTDAEWEDAPVAVTEEKPYLWMKSQRKDAEGNDDGAPVYIRLTGVSGADGVQSNLYGYETNISADSTYCFHTVNGFAVLAKATEDGEFIITLDNGGMFPAGIYSFSGEIELVRINNVPSHLTVAVCVGSGENAIREYAYQNSSLTFAVKMIADEPFMPTVKVSGLNADSSIVLIKVGNLKIEHAEHLSGISTPFDGLASDNLQGQNLIVGSATFGNGDWSYGDNVTIVPMMYQGNDGFHLLGGEVSNVTPLLPNTVYCLSVYARNAGNPTDFAVGTRMGANQKGVIVDSEGRASYQSETREQVMVFNATSEWRRYFVTFKTGADVEGQMLFFRPTDSEGIDLCMPKLEECEKATLWMLNEEDRTGQSISKVNNYYAWSTSGTVAPIEGFAENEIPEHTDGLDYLWNYETNIDKKGNVISQSPTTCIGFFPKGVESITEYYIRNNGEDVTPPVVSEDGKTLTLGDWSREVEKTDADNRYVWNVEVVKFSDGTYSVGTPHCAGVQGEASYNVVIIAVEGSTVIRNGQGSLTLKAFVYRGTEDITDTLENEQFVWHRQSSSAEADAEWNSKDRTGNIMVIEADDVNRSAIFECKIIELV